MAVVGIGGFVPEIERLDGAAIGMVPTIYGNAIWAGGIVQLGADDDVFFVAGGESVGGFSSGC